MNTPFQTVPVTQPGDPPRAWPPPRRRIIEPLVVAFQASPSMREQVGPDALREVLGFSLGEMTAAPGVVRLAPLYEILKNQPGFTAEKAAEPLARFKSFELSLGYQVELPPDLAALPPQVLDQAAARAPVSSLQLLEALDPPRTKSNGKMPAVAERPVEKPRRKLGLPIALVLGFTGAAFFLVPEILDRLEEQKIDVATVSKAIPLRSARIFEDSLELTLRDADWVKEKDREAALKDALKNAVASGLEVTRAVVLDDDGKLRATALLVDGDVRTSFVD